MPARLFSTDLDRVSTEVLAHPDEETGGSLFGAWSHTGQPLIYLVTGPGRDARHDIASFYPCEQALARTGRLLFDRGGLQHIGEWHSHHRIALARPSAGDVRTVWRGMEAHGLRRFVLGIANIEGNRWSPRVPVAFFLFDADRGDWDELPVEHWRGESPLQSLAPELNASWTRGPSGQQGRGRWRVAEPRPAPRPVSGSAWYADPAVRGRLARELKRMNAHPHVDGDARLRPDGRDLVLTARVRGLLLRWELSEGFPSRAPRLTCDGIVLGCPWRAFEGLGGQVDQMVADWEAELAPPLVEPQPTPALQPTPEPEPTPALQPAAEPQRAAESAPLPHPLPTLEPPTPVLVEEVPETPAAATVAVAPVSPATLRPQHTPSRDSAWEMQLSYAAAPAPTPAPSLAEDDR